jgi:predicted nucleic acid-binding protein
MIFTDIPADTCVFVDANTLVYHFAADPQFGSPCTDLVKQIERKEVRGFVSTHVLSDVAHRLMTVEAILLFGWPVASIA